VRVAVTGANGFLGRHILRSLAAKPGVETIAYLRPAAPQGTAPAVEILDLSAPDIALFTPRTVPDVVIDAAWGGLPNYRSRHHFEIEAPAHYAFLRRMLDLGTGKLVSLGTCFEYGMRDGRLDESLNANPHLPYGHGKDMLRRQLAFLRREVAFESTWARLFYLHGETAAARGLFTLLRDAVARNDTHFDLTGGEQLRDYLPVEEAARRIVALALTPGDHGIVNICSGRPTSIRSLVEGWVRQHGWRIELRWGALPYNDWEPFAFWGDDRKQNDLLAVRPSGAG
jgi:nucleoside-diphosphate-sugar epimerase